jgi:hypothetical protein
VCKCSLIFHCVFTYNFFFAELKNSFFHEYFQSFIKQYFRWNKWYLSKFPLHLSKKKVTLMGCIVLFVFFRHGFLVLIKSSRLPIGISLNIRRKLSYSSSAQVVVLLFGASCRIIIRRKLSYYSSA